MIMPTVDEDRIRITARTPPGMRKHFVVRSVVGEELRLLQRETTIRLSREGAKQVLDLIDHPPRANRRLRQALRLHSKLIRGA